MRIAARNGFFVGGWRRGVVRWWGAVGAVSAKKGLALAAGSAQRAGMMDKRRVVIVGGGAAGYFAAIACAEQLGAAGDVTIYEATAHPLAKVRVSGGGRCNVTHACFEPRELVKKYPRGGRELMGAFHKFQPRDMVAWLAERGVETKTEDDGRMFPVTDDSATIVDCLTRAAETAGVKVITSMGVRKVERVGASGAGDFWVTLTDNTGVRCERLLLATGGNKSSAGLTIAGSFGHTIEPPVPSLFTFHIDDARLIGLSGLSVENAVVTVAGTKLKTDGPLLITHWGASGPAILKLSAWGARELAEVNYEFYGHAHPRVAGEGTVGGARQESQEADRDVESAGDAAAAVGTTGRFIRNRGDDGVGPGRQHRARHARDAAHGGGVEGGREELV